MLQFPEHIDRIATLAEVSEVRHRVISHNLANVNTPGYQRLDISFDHQLLFAKRRQESDSVSDSVVVQTQGEATRMDGNSVDLDQEVGHLNQNAMLFQVYSQILATHLDTMRRAIQS